MMMTPGNAIRDAGYLIVRSLYDQHEVEEMRGAMERLRELASALLEIKDPDRDTLPEHRFVRDGSEIVVARTAGVDQIKRVLWAGATEPDLLRYGRDRRLTSIVAELLGTNEADQLINQVHFKLPNDGVDDYDWHQDATHRRYGTPEWDLSAAPRSYAYIQTLMAIHPHTMENGPLLVVPGRYGPTQLLKGTDGKPQLPPPWDEREAIPVLLAPGDVAFFHEYLLHKSDPNTSHHPRYTLINGFAYPGVNGRKYPGVDAGAGSRIRLR